MNVKSIAPRERIDCSDPPFAVPPDIEVHLPMPPSVNRIWRSNRAGAGVKRVSISPEYASWRKAADNLAIALGSCRGVKKIIGKFEAIIILQRTRGDLDNRVKGLLDWAQSRQLVADDKHCERLTVEWGEAPYGCRLILRNFVSDYPLAGKTLGRMADALPGGPDQNAIPVRKARGMIGGAA